MPPAAIYGASRKKLTATSCCAPLGQWPVSLEPVNRQITMMLARASTPQSRPKPSNATDPAMTAAATPASTIPYTRVQT